MKPTGGALPSSSNPHALAPSIQDNFIPFPSGPVALESSLYIQRDIERQAYGELQAPGCLLRLHGPSKNGKTSLLLRLLHQAKDWNYAVIFIDFQTVERSILSDLDSFLRWLCANIIRQISSQHSSTLLSGINDFWDDSLGAGINCTDCLEQMVLEALDTPIVLALNEVNQAMSQPELLQDFLSLLRFWHEQSKHQELWKKLRLILVYSTECYVPLRIDRSPFNVGFAVKLPPFTLAEVQLLAIRHGFDWAQGEAGQAELEPLMTLTGGNPYLIRLTLHAIHESSDDLADVLGKALLPEGPYFPHLRERAQFLQEEPDLARALSVIFTAEGIEQLHPREIYHLENAGFIRYKGKHILPSCELYHQFFQDLLSSSDAFTPNRDSSGNSSSKHVPTDFQQPPKQHHVS